MKNITVCTTNDVSRSSRKVCQSLAEKLIKKIDFELVASPAIGGVSWLSSFKILKVPNIFVEGSIICLL